MRERPLSPVVRLCFLLTIAAYFVNCQGVQRAAPVALGPNAKFQGALMWKGDPSGTGAYLNEVKLTPANVNAGQFGRLGSFQADGIVMGQPLYVSELDVAAAGTRNVIILTTEHDSVYAIDADNPGSGPLWERHYVDPANRVTTMPDSFGGLPWVAKSESRGLLTSMARRESFIS